MRSGLNETKYLRMHSSDPKRGGVNCDYLSRRGGSEKLKKAGGSMVQGQVLLKGRGLTLFLFFFFKVYHFYI